ncbi:hypothetical protein HNQ90_002702 [Algibacter amylolyticus]|nr:hypothetical protein [Algibacter amylolyticus]
MFIDEYVLLIEDLIVNSILCLYLNIILFYNKLAQTS